MKIAVNTRLLLRNKLEGIGRFTFETLKRITNNHPECTFYFIFDRPFAEEFIFSDNIVPIVAPPRARHPLLFIVWFELVIPKILKKYKVDLFLSPDGYLSLRTKTPSIPVIHDINFAHRPKDLPFFVRKYYNYYFPRFAKKASAIATVSGYSKKDIAKTYGLDENKIDIVYNGVNKMYQPLAKSKIDAVKQELTSGANFFLYVGSLHKRKNITSVLKAFDEFCKSNSDYRLVIAGEKMFGGEEIDKCLDQLSYRSNVIFTGRLTDNELLRVQGSAYCLLFVPFFEGFGLPMIESMACGVPVITSNVTSLPEVAGDAALYADPNNYLHLTEKMKRLISDKNLYQRFVQKGLERAAFFTWDNTANHLWKTIEKVLSQHQK